MTAFPDSHAQLGAPRPAETVQSHQVEDVYWGYIVRDRSRAPVGLILGQVVAVVAGLGLIALAAGLWSTPAAGQTVLGMRIAATVVLLGLAALFGWFASRGTQSELQVDLRQGEVREVVRNRAGSPTLLARYGFDALGGVFIQRGQVGGRACLTVRIGNTAQLLPVAVGHEAHLAPLRDRIGRDLLSARPVNMMPPRPVRRAA